MGKKTEDKNVFFGLAGVHFPQGSGIRLDNRQGPGVKGEDSDFLMLGAGNMDGWGCWENAMEWTGLE